MMVHEKGETAMLISEEAKKSLERNLRLPYEQIIALSPLEGDAHVEKVTGEKLTFSNKLAPWHMRRGEPLLSRRKFKTVEKVDAMRIEP